MMKDDIRAGVISRLGSQCGIVPPTSQSRRIVLVE